MTEPSPRRAHHRPHLVSPGMLDSAGAEFDPATIIATAHETADALVRRGRAERDPELTARLVALVDEIGLDELAGLWADRPPRSLPGALWRLYALREWIRRAPLEASRSYSSGVPFAEVSHAIAGAAEPTGPSEVKALADQILSGVYDGDVAVALDRAAAFCGIVAAGRAAGAQAPSEQAAAMLQTSKDLTACARAWRDGTLE